MRVKFASCLIAGALIAPLAGFSAESDIKIAKKKSSNRLLEEVIVSAQKRDESSQDVPISIQAFSGEKLEAFGIETTHDLQKITPGLTFTYIYGYMLICIQY